MDLIDILMARALTPAAQAEAAAAAARKAAADATTAVDAAQDALERAEAAVETAENIDDIIVIQPDYPERPNVTKVWIDNDSQDTCQIPVLEDITAEIKQTTFTKQSVTGADSITNNINITYSDDTTTNINNISKYYTSTGTNTDGAMTQKAITEALAGASINFGRENKGKIVIVGNDGSATTGTITEEEIIEAIIHDGSTVIEGTLGLQADYENKNFARTQEARTLSMGADFNIYPMYGGRRRCNVADDGTITAFYGENGYTEDGSNGQVMIYQPKFYYYRAPEKMVNGTIGKIVRKEELVISYTSHPGFKLHPLFKTPTGEELDYVLLSAYESCVYDNSASEYMLNDEAGVDFTVDKLSSIAAAKPVSGVNKNFTPETAEQLAQNRGAGWHITNMAAESANQMLAIIEFGAFNGQTTIEAGISSVPNVAGINCSSYTGSTAALGNGTGHASATINETNGNTTTYTDPGKRAISYRGMENPWGNTWRIIGGTNIYGNSMMAGGVPYICSDYNYTPTSIGSNYTNIGFSLPSVYGWISALGYGDSQYDWVLMPAECSGANSALPIGDSLWTVANLNAINMCLLGGIWNFGDNNGLFYYSCDNRPTNPARSISARLMYIPTAKDEIYTANIAKWGG